MPNVIAARFGDTGAARLRMHAMPTHDLLAAYPFSLSIRLHGAVACGQISSPSHALAVRHAGGHFDVSLATSAAAMLDRDFVLLSDGLAGSSIATIGRDVDGYVAEKKLYAGIFVVASAEGGTGGRTRALSTAIHRNGDVMKQASLASARSGHLLRNFIFILTLGTSIHADAFGNKASWREEVLQHDGSRLTVDRSQVYGGYPRIDSRERAVIEETWQFKVPGRGREVTWKNEFGLAPDKSSLDLLILGFVDGVPYIVAAPADCISYNKWERPNPPYVVLRFDGQELQRIPLSRVPAQFSKANVVVGTPLKPNRSGTLSVDTIKEENRNLPPYLRVLVRAPITYGDGNMAESCPVMVYDGQGGWRSPDGPKAPHPIVAPSSISREK